MQKKESSKNTNLLHQLKKFITRAEIAHRPLSCSADPVAGGDAAAAVAAAVACNSWFKFFIVQFVI